MCGARARAPARGRLQSLREFDAERVEDPVAAEALRDLRSAPGADQPDSQRVEGIGSRVGRIWTDSPGSVLPAIHSMALPRQIHP